MEVSSTFDFTHFASPLVHKYSEGIRKGINWFLRVINQRWGWFVSVRD